MKTTLHIIKDLKLLFKNSKLKSVIKAEDWSLGDAKNQSGRIKIKIVLGVILIK